MVSTEVFIFVGYLKKEIMQIVFPATMTIVAIVLWVVWYNLKPESTTPTNSFDEWRMAARHDNREFVFYWALVLSLISGGIWLAAIVE